MPEATRTRPGILRLDSGGIRASEQAFELILDEDASESDEPEEGNPFNFGR